MQAIVGFLPQSVWPLLYCDIFFSMVWNTDQISQWINTALATKNSAPHWFLVIWRMKIVLPPYFWASTSLKVWIMDVISNIFIFYSGKSLIFDPYHVLLFIPNVICFANVHWRTNWHSYLACMVCIAVREMLESLPLLCRTKDSMVFSALLKLSTIVLVKNSLPSSNN